MADTINDLRRLERDLQDGAVLVDAGEVRWPSHLVAAAINGLADLGLPLRALLCARRDASGRVVGEEQLAIATEDDVELTRTRLLDALPLLRGEHGSVMWQAGR